MALRRVANAHGMAEVARRALKGVRRLMREILEFVVSPIARVKPGSLLADMGKRAALSGV